MSNSKIQTINRTFQIYQEEVLIGTASQGQVIECKRAFFAGAHAVLLILTCQISALPDKEAEAELQSLLKQCEGFMAAVEMGEA